MTRISYIQIFIGGVILSIGYSLKLKRVSGPLFIKDYDTQFNSMLFKNEDGAVEPNIRESIVIHINKGFYPYYKKLNAI